MPAGQSGNWDTHFPATTAVLMPDHSEPSCSQKLAFRTSLVVQWLRIHQPMKGTWVRSLVKELLSCQGATKPCTTTTESGALEPGNPNYWAHVLKLLKPIHLEPCLQQNKPAQWEAHTSQLRVAPTHCQRKPSCSNCTAKNKDPGQPK